jgi:cytochrome o ubiquinol oxidase subunit 2
MGESAQFSGDGFSDMQFQVRSVPAADFGAWVQQAQGAGAVLDRARYAQLQRQSQRDPPAVYRLADPQLFQAIAAQTLPPGPGPEPEGGQHAGRETSTGGRK